MTLARVSFHSELKALQVELMKMGVAVEEAIHYAVKSLAEKDSVLAQRVIEGDDAIDALEHQIEDACLRLLALQQPMAGDLRIIGTALKIVTDLERMADHAVDIAKVTLRIEGQPLIKPLVDIPRMADIAKAMTREALNAYVNRDKDAALAMIHMDDGLDHLYGAIFTELLMMMSQDPSIIAQATYLLHVALHLERIGDHCTNLGEWVIYMVTGVREELNK
jgi:phosphate transport system protein